MSMIPGRYTTKGCSVQNKRRIYFANYKNKSPIKKRRNVIRERKKRKNDEITQKEGHLYEAGGF